MTHNLPAEDDHLSWLKLWTEARLLSDADIISLEQKLLKNPDDLETRFKLFSIYSELDENHLKRQDADQCLSKHVLWFIQNKPDCSGFLGHQLASAGNRFQPKTFAALRQAWLDQVSVEPNEAAVVGNAAKFIACNDIELASDLFERAHALQPEEGWLGWFLIYYNSELYTCPFLYKEEVCKRIIDIGVRSLQTESGGAQFLTCEYVMEAALYLRRFDVVRWCAEGLYNFHDPICDQIANAYLGMVALRENDQAQAVGLMLQMKRGYQPHPLTFRLAHELFDAGERKSISQFIKNLKKKIQISARNRWLKQLAIDQRPDFEDYCRCSTCTENAPT